MSQQPSKAPGITFYPYISDSSRSISISTNIGTLSKLPGEIRNQIWKSLGVKSVGIFQTCRQLKHEAESGLFSGNIRIFLYANPTLAWARVKTGTTIWRFQDFEDARRMKIPFQKFCRIKISICPPDYADPGQLICLWQKTRQLVAFLQDSKMPSKLPDIDLILLNSGLGSWIRDDSPQNTFPSIASGGADPQTVLLPFASLRNVGHVRVLAPSGALHWDRVAFRKTLQSSIAFGTRRAENQALRRLNDSQLKITYDTTWYEFDSLLDNLPSPAARHLRLQRFVDWFHYEKGGCRSEYLEKIARCYKHSIFSELEARRIKLRYRFMMALNPMSEKVQIMREGYDLAPGRIDDNAYMQLKTGILWNAESKLALQAYCKESFDGRWYDTSLEQRAAAKSVQGQMARREQWLEYYPYGIPAFNDKKRQLWLNVFGTMSGCPKEREVWTKFVEKHFNDDFF